MKMAHGTFKSNKVVLTGMGKFLKAYKKHNYGHSWALAGGGSGVFSVVLSLTSKSSTTYPLQLQRMALQGPQVFILHVLVASGITAPAMRYSASATKARMHSGTRCLKCLAGLFGSVCIYRIYFHRLRKFPGPQVAAFSKPWHAWACRDSRNHLVLDSLHQQYGTFVRAGMPASATVRVDYVMTPSRSE